MNAKLFAFAAAPALLVALAPSANAAYNGDYSYLQIRKAHTIKTSDVNITPLENGYQLSISSDNERTQAKLQNTAQARADKSRERVDKTVNTTSTGVTITKTTDSERLGNRLSWKAEHPKAALYIGYQKRH